MKMLLSAKTATKENGLKEKGEYWRNCISVSVGCLDFVELHSALYVVKQRSTQV